MKWLKKLLGIRSPSEELIQEGQIMMDDFLDGYKERETDPVFQKAYWKLQRYVQFRSKLDPYMKKRKIRKARIRNGLM
jgi:hypothetical protein